MTFKHVASVTKIFEKTRNMRKDSRIITYIPKQFHTRFCAIKDLDKKLRQEEKCQTRIKMGLRDLQLLKKDRAIGKWEHVPIPANFPPVELGSSTSRTVSGSPAPGRPGQGRGDKRGRESTGSSNGDNTPKARKVSENLDQTDDTSDGNKMKGSSLEQMRLDRDQAWKATIEAADLLGDAIVSPGKDGHGLQRQLDSHICFRHSSQAI